MNNRSRKQYTIQFCPSCNHHLLNPKSLVNHFDVAEDTAYFCWCSNCHWVGEIKQVVRVTAHELEEN